MSMKKWIYGVGIFLSLLPTSCIKEKDLSEPGGEPSLENFDASFGFRMRTQRLLTITARHADGRAASEVPFNVYLENPYGDEGKLQEEVQPIAGSVTGEDGVWTSPVDIPNQVKIVYVTTPYVGYGGMQTCEVSDYMNLVFQGTRTLDVSRTTRAVSATGEITRPGRLYNRNTNVYVLYQNEFFDTCTKLFYDVKSVDPELITSEDITHISAIANQIFPEMKAVDDEKYFDYNTDLAVVEPVLGDGETYGGTQVWVTFLGDGGFSINNISVVNSLCYYTYPTANPPTGQDGIRMLHKTLIYPNTNERRFAQYLVGSKIQLMYWDTEKQEYTTQFPEGVSIGWALVSGNNKDVNSDGGNIGDLSAFRFSTPVLNDYLDHPYHGAYANGIGRWSEAGKCNIVGMENRLHLDEGLFNDMDYNDILLKVESNPVIKPKDVIPVPEKKYEYGVSGTLAFEDCWPKKGDYDFNDFVTDYTYTLVKESEKSNILEKIRLLFVPRAAGAAFMSGFGIQLPISPDAIERVEGAELELNEDLASLIVCANTHSIFGVRDGIVNTVKGQTALVADPITVTVVLKKGNVQDDVFPTLISRFNPFLFVQTRNKEIHLVDMLPTGKMDLNLFGTEDDGSDGIGYYRLKQGRYPWALDIPCTTKNGTWRYPQESTDVSKVYPDYVNWTNLDGHETDWIQRAEEDLLY